MTDLLPLPEGVLEYQIEEDGPIYVARNKIVSSYRPILAKAVACIPSITHFALGDTTITTAVAKTETALRSERFRGLVSDIVSETASFTVIYRMPVGVGNGITYREAGIFDAATGGNMFCRVLLPNAVVKTASVSPLFKWTIALTAAT